MTSKVLGDLDEVLKTWFAVKWTFPWNAMGKAWYNGTKNRSERRDAIKLKLCVYFLLNIQYDQTRNVVSSFVLWFAVYRFYSLGWPGDCSLKHLF